MAAPLLQVALLDERGNRIQGSERAVGSPLPEEILREAAPEVLSASKRAAPANFRSTPLAAGETRVFQVVVAELDAAAHRVMLEAAPPGNAAVLGAEVHDAQPADVAIEEGMEAAGSPNDSLVVEPSAKEEPSALETDSVTIPAEMTAPENADEMGSI